MLLINGAIQKRSQHVYTEAVRDSPNLLETQVSFNLLLVCTVFNGDGSGF
jgi:hypothetical protein